MNKCTLSIRLRAHVRRSQQTSPLRTVRAGFGPITHTAGAMSACAVSSCASNPVPVHDPCRFGGINICAMDPVVFEKFYPRRDVSWRSKSNMYHHASEAGIWLSCGFFFVLDFMRFHRGKAERFK